MPTDELNQGDNLLGIDPSDSECPECGREVNRRLYSYRAYCPRCDTLTGRIKAFAEEKPYPWHVLSVLSLGVLTLAFGVYRLSLGMVIGGAGLLGMGVTTAYQIGWFQ